MVAVSTTLQRRGVTRPYIYVTIEGVGYVSGGTAYQYRFYVETSDPTSAQHKAIMRDYPSLLSEDLDPLGGIATAGELSIALVDVDDFVTGFLRTDTTASYYITSAMTAAQTTVTLNTTTTSDTIIYIGGEAILVGSNVSGSTYNCTRAQLGTTATTHAARDDVFSYLPNIMGRQIRLWLGFKEEEDADTGLVAIELGGGWAIDDVQLEDHLNTWMIRGRNQLKYLDRLVYRNAYKAVIRGLGDNPDVSALPVRQTGGKLQSHFTDYGWAKVGDQICWIYLGGDPPATTLTITEKGKGGTAIEAFSEGDVVQQVYLASDISTGSFRWQLPGVENNTRSSASYPWYASDHPVVILLNILTGKADINDTTPDNYTSGKGNYSGLPPGVGIGVPASQIDFDSFLAVMYRTEGYALPNFVIDETVTARELIIDKILRVCGFVLKLRDSKLYLELPRIPYANETTSASWDDDDISTEAISNGMATPMISAMIDKSSAASTIVFKTLTPQGRELTTEYSDATYKQLTGNYVGYYGTEESKIEIDAQSIRSDESGGEPQLLTTRAMGLLYRYRRPPWLIKLSTDLSYESVEPGDLVDITNSQIPNRTTGTRGWTAVIGQVKTKTIVINQERVGIDWEIMCWQTAGNYGRVTPSAIIVSYASTTITTYANYFTDPEALDGNPTSDAAAFAVGDRVRLRSYTGELISTTPTYQTITSLGTNTITVDGNWGGALATAALGYILEYVDRDDQAAQQYDTYVSLADETIGTVGASSQAAWTFGEA